MNLKETHPRQNLYSFEGLSQIQKILIIKLRAIGDVVLATPVIENLRGAFPDADIDFLTEPPSAAIVAHHPDLNQIIVYPRQRWKRTSVPRRWCLDAAFLRHLHAQKYDLVFDLFGNPRSAIMTLATGAAKRVGYNFRGRQLAYNRVVLNRGAEVHEVEFNLDALRALSIPIFTAQPAVYVTAEDSAFITEWFAHRRFRNRRVIGLNPSGSWPAKRWPDEKFIELGHRLSDQLNASLVVLWGPGEKKTAQRIAAGIGEHAYLAPPTSLNQLAALCKRLSALVSNDSGPMHISAAVGTPTLGIYGPTNSKLQGPYGKKNRGVAHWEIPCLGCNRLKCPLLDCMHYLSVREVFQETVKMLGRD